MIRKKLLILVIFFISIFGYSQSKQIEVLKLNKIKYYYVYEVLDINTKDTLIILSSKKDKEFNIIRLNINKCYEIETRLKSAIKISENEYYFCRPNRTTIDNIIISNENTLPILILNYKELGNDR